MYQEHDAIDGEALVRMLRLGERQTAGPLAVFPVFLDRRAHRDGGPRPSRYITLRQALAEGRAQITEVSEGGSVPDLRVVNKGDTRVLLLDGEELRGAKQNRVLNVTVLVDKFSTLVVPVSCTEAGRWAYASREFAESEVLAERQVRATMRRDVQRAALMGMPARAQQGEVWREVDALHSRQGTHSATSAMRDAYEARKADLDGMIAAFPLRDGQNGVLVLHGDRVIGLDVISRAPQYAELHDKLLRSYSFEALVSGGRPGDRPAADEFLGRIAGLAGQRFKSAGLGWDARFEGAGVLGSALIHRGFVVHAAFFNVGEDLSRQDPQPQDPRPQDRRPDWRIADARLRARRRQGR